MNRMNNELAKKCGEAALVGVAMGVGVVVILPSLAAYYVVDKTGRLLSRNPISMKLRERLSAIFDVVLGRTIEILPPGRHALNGPPDFFRDGEPQPFAQHKPSLGVKRGNRPVEYCHQG